MKDKKGNELTEREVKLLNFIGLLIDITNRYSIFYALISRDCNWVDSVWEKDKVREHQNEMIKYLTDEFGEILSVKSGKEILDVTKTCEAGSNPARLFNALS